nr:PREDICTED: protein croquemort-like isoform X1 [Bemisia tabaci]
MHLKLRHFLSLSNCVMDSASRIMTKECDVKFISLCSGIAVSVVAALSFILWPWICKFVISLKLPLTPTSDTYAIWRDTPIPMHIDFYFFNWTNPHELLDPEKKPEFVQMGPYRFIETKEKVNITWNVNHTVSYQQRKWWYFDAENSKGKLTDNITTLNVVALAASNTVKNWAYVMQSALSTAMSQTSQNISVTKPAGQLLFDGYEDKLIDLAMNFPSMITVPYDKFGWFYTRNGSAEFDGYFNIDVGSEDIEDFGRIRNWNYASRTDYYSGECGELRGSGGELFPPDMQQTKITLFSPDMCRSVILEYERTVEHSGMEGYRFVGGLDMVDNGTHDAANECLCDGECVPQGLSNATSCRYGVPAFISYPHFYLADPVYREDIRGMRPDKDLHQFQMTFEPTTGVPLEVKARLQINILLTANPSVMLFEKVPSIFFPMIWFENKATITEELAEEVKLALYIFENGRYGAAMVLFLGITLILITLVVQRIFENPQDVRKSTQFSLCPQ